MYRWTLNANQNQEVGYAFGPRWVGGGVNDLQWWN